MKGKRQEQSRAQKSPTLVIICGWLLAAEAVEFFLLGVYHFHLNQGPALFSTLFAQWLRGETPLNAVTMQQFIHQLTETAASAQLLVALNESAILFVLTILTLWSAVGFFRLWPIAWTAAIFVQVCSLLTALVLYFLSKPMHIMFMMVSGIFMVLYLNYADVQAFFYNRGMQRRAERGR